MNCGRKILEALIIYCKIDVQATLNEIYFKNKRKSHHPHDDEESKESLTNPSYMSLNLESLQKEL
jgi:hypothetical protein